MKANVTGLILIIGSVIFWGGSFMPINSRFYAQKDPQKQLAMVEAESGAWRIVQLVFIVGALITLVGMWGVTQHLKGTQAGFWSWIGLAGFLTGVVLWCWFAVQRGINPASYIRPEEGGKPILLHADMLVLTLALLAYGIAFRQAAFPGWLTWGTIGLSIIFVAYQVIFKDMIPMFHYIPTLALGIHMVT